MTINLRLKKNVRDTQRSLCALFVSQFKKKEFLIKKRSKISLSIQESVAFKLLRTTYKFNVL